MPKLTTLLNAIYIELWLSLTLKGIMAHLGCTPQTNLILCRTMMNFSYTPIALNVYLGYISKMATPNLLQAKVPVCMVLIVSVHPTIMM